MAVRYAGQRRVASVLTDGAVALGDVVVQGFVTLPPGTAAAPSLRFTGFTTTGIAAPAGVLTAAGAGVSRFTFGSTNSSASPFAMGANYISFTEMTAPGAGAVNVGRLYTVDVAGKTRLEAVFNTGATQTIVTEP